jgi:hypothetical protein
MADSENTKPKRTYEENLALAKARVGAAPVLQLQPGTVVASVQIPIWPDVVRGIPNGFLRSALFGAVMPGPRRYIEGGVVTENGK